MYRVRAKREPLRSFDGFYLKAKARIWLICAIFAREVPREHSNRSCPTVHRDIRRTEHAAPAKPRQNAEPRQTGHAQKRQKGHDAEHLDHNDVFKAHRLLYQSTLGLRVTQKKKTTATSRGASNNNNLSSPGCIQQHKSSKVFPCRSEAGAPLCI